jgi:hypothetical protein
MIFDQECFTLNRIRLTCAAILMVIAALTACQPQAAPTNTPAPATSAPSTTSAPTATTAPPSATPNTELTPPAEGVLPFDDGSAGDPAAARAVEAYLTAKVAGDRDGVRDGLCAAMEGDLDREALSFSGVEASIEDMTCVVNATSTTVTCQGNIIAVYGGENRPIALASYSVVNEDGIWRWCGEAE